MTTTEINDNIPNTGIGQGSAAKTARHRRTAPFAQIATAALLDASLSLRAKGLLALMLSRPDGWDFYMTELRQRSLDGREATQSAMQELLEHGYCTRAVKRGQGGLVNGWSYTVTDCPQPRPVQPESGEKSGKRSDRRTVEPSDGARPLSKKDFTQMDVQSSAAAAPRGEEKPNETLNPGPPSSAEHAAACQLFRNAFQSIRMRHKERVIERQAREALAAGFRLPDLEAALRWVQQDSWWHSRLVPGNLNEMLPRWDAATGGGVRTGGMQQPMSPGAGQAQPVEGERWQAPSGEWRTVAEVVDGHVFWHDHQQETPLPIVLRWPAEVTG